MKLSKTIHALQLILGCVPKIHQKGDKVTITTPAPVTRFQLRELQMNFKQVKQEETSCKITFKMR